MTLVVFDLDDTLYLERHYVRSGFKAVAAHLGNPAFSDTCWWLFERGVRGNILDLGLQELRLPSSPDLVRTLVEVYRSHAPKIVLEPDARICLDALRGRAATGLVTDGRTHTQRAKIEALQLGRWIDRMIVTDELGAEGAKPSPLAFRKLQEQHDPRRCFYVADNPAKDFQGPIELGWHTVRIRRAGGLYADAPDDPKFPAEASVDSLDVLPELVKA